MPPVHEQEVDPQWPRRLTATVLLSLAVGCTRRVDLPPENEPTVPRVEHRQTATPPGVNLARTSLASVTASSVNGTRELDNVFYGVTNAFDDGSNWHNGINYTYWLSDPGDLRPSIEIVFEVPVEVSSIVVENGPEFSTVLATAKGKDRHCDPAEAMVTFAEAIPDVQRVGLTFSKPEALVRVDEIRVLGDQPEALPYEVCRPAIIKTRDGPSVE